MSKSSFVLCSCVFLTKIVFVENDERLNSDFEKLKLVIRLLKKLEQFPQIIENSRTALEPQTIATYLYDTANSFHKFYSDCRVITEDLDLTQSRIALIKGVKIILSNGLSILGITAPERM